MSLDRERGNQIVRVGVQTRERDIGPICVLQSHGICAILIHPSIHPSSLILPSAKVAWLSAMVGESYTSQMRFSPRPFLKRRRVCEACAMMLPPMGLVASLAKLMPSGLATTWFVSTTAMPYS